MARLSFWKLASIFDFSSVSVAMALVSVDICCFSWLIVGATDLVGRGTGDCKKNVWEEVTLEQVHHREF